MQHEKTHAKKCIVVCMGGDCREHGAKKVFKEFEDTLEASGAEEKIALHKCGCMGACKDGPNVVVYPGGDQFLGVRPRNVTKIVDNLASKAAKQ